MSSCNDFSEYQMIQVGSLPWEKSHFNDKADALSLVVANPVRRDSQTLPDFCFSLRFVAAPRKTAAVYEEEEGNKSGY